MSAFLLLFGLAAGKPGFSASARTNFQPGIEPSCSLHYARREVRSHDVGTATGGFGTQTPGPAPMSRTPGRARPRRRRAMAPQRGARWVRRTVIIWRPGGLVGRVTLGAYLGPISRQISPGIPGTTPGSCAAIPPVPCGHFPRAKSDGSETIGRPPHEYDFFASNRDRHLPVHRHRRLHAHAAGAREGYRDVQEAHFAIMREAIALGEGP